MTTQIMETETLRPEPPVGIKDVAAAAGVSLGTVSNVINRPELVSLEMQERVQAVIRDLGFVRNGSASRLRSTQSKVIGVVVLDIGNPYFAELARGVEEVAEELGFSVMLCNSDGSSIREERHLSFLEEQRVGGVLVTPTRSGIPKARSASMQAHGVSLVLVDHASTELDRCSVAVDDEQGGYLAGQHLLGSGRRNITYLSGPRTIRQCADREAGLRRAIAEFCEHNDDSARMTVVEVAALNGRAGLGATAEIVESGCDALFAANDLLALGVLRGLQELAVKIPDDMAIVGYDDIDFASLATIPLSSVRQPALQVGRSAARLLLEECTTTTHAHQQILFRPELVIRESSST